MSKIKARMTGQKRHVLGSVSAMIIGAGLADTQEIETITGVFNMLGLAPEIQAAIGLVGLAVAHIWSWLDRSKRKNEGDE